MNRQPPGYGPGHLPFDSIPRLKTSDSNCASCSQGTRATICTKHAFACFKSCFAVFATLRVAYPYCVRIPGFASLNRKLLHHVLIKATMKGIEPLPPERQSGTLTITPHSHIGVSIVHGYSDTIINNTRSIDTKLSEGNCRLENSSVNCF